MAWPVAATLSAADAADRTLLSGIAAAMVARFSKSAGPYHMFQVGNSLTACLTDLTAAVDRSVPFRSDRPPVAIECSSAVAQPSAALARRSCAALL